MSCDVPRKKAARVICWSDTTRSCSHCLRPPCSSACMQLTGPVADRVDGEERKQLVKSAGVIGIATFSSRILGFIRDMVLAGLFGATPAADAFFVAYRVPNLLRELFAEGSMSSAFIPVFAEYQTRKSKRDAWELASAVFTTLLTIVTGITILGIIVASGIVWVLAPGFHDDPAKLGMTTLLTRIMFPYLVFIS